MYPLDTPEYGLSPFTRSPTLPPTDIRWSAYHTTRGVEQSDRRPRKSCDRISGAEGVYFNGNRVYGPAHATPRPDDHHQPATTQHDRDNRPLPILPEKAMPSARPGGVSITSRVADLRFRVGAALELLEQLAALPPR